MPIEYYIFIAICWGLGGVITGFAGFGAALIAMPIIAMVVPMHIAVPCGTIVAFFMNIQMIRNYWRHIDWKRLLPMVCATPFGAFTGVSFARSVDGAYLQLGLGILLACFSIWALLFEERKERRPVHRAWGVLAGFSSSAIGSSIGMGGPPTIVFTSLSGWSKDRIKAGISGYFLVAGAVMLSFQIWAGLQNTSALLAACVSIPTIYLGIRLGINLSKKVGERSYRKNLFRMLILFAVIILYKAITQLWFS
ncbi:sulfite exporter TauE/SafE family protein [Desulfotalea psychrophila]|uniref:Probable membrane transporter protein n=1 Tax=Desulfotalea psychrophila (strain LSv54 / DSM 12343) TaxID=177439 RepID=Q6APE2_DESPS|nr:sulfite exporter TauE/SafE family protein [Desulfotalea psychrophila]CAG35782.1 hypothetical membrane protein [Desulfotalea psychrophila LSv54]